VSFQALTRSSHQGKGEEEEARSKRQEARRKRTWAVKTAVLEMPWFVCSSLPACSPCHTHALHVTHGSECHAKALYFHIYVHIHVHVHVHVRVHVHIFVASELKALAHEGSLLDS